MQSGCSKVVMRTAAHGAQKRMLQDVRFLDKQEFVQLARSQMAAKNSMCTFEVILLQLCLA